MFQYHIFSFILGNKMHSVTVCFSGTPALPVVRIKNAHWNCIYSAVMEQLSFTWLSNSWTHGLEFFDRLKTRRLKPYQFSHQCSSKASRTVPCTPPLAWLPQKCLLPTKWSCCTSTVLWLELNPQQHNWWLQELKMVIWILSARIKQFSLA